MNKGTTMIRRSMAPCIWGACIALTALPAHNVIANGPPLAAHIAGDDVWLRMRGTKYTAPMDLQRDSTAITVNGTRYEIVVDERPPGQRIVDGDYGEYEVYQYLAERIASARSAVSPVPEDTLTAIASEANAFLVAKGLPAIGIMVESSSNNATILQDGSDSGVRVEIKAHRPMSRPEITHRNFAAIVDMLEYGRSVIWGDNYFASYARAQAVAVDQAIEEWILEKSEVSRAPEDESARVEIGDVMVPKGLLFDLRFSQ